MLVWMPPKTTLLNTLNTSTPSPQPRAAKAEIALHAQILVEEARVAEIVRQRPRRVSEREGRRGLERVAIDVGRRIGPEHVAVAIVAVDPDVARERGVEIRVAVARALQVARRPGDGAQRPAGSVLGYPGDLPVPYDRSDDGIAAPRLAWRAERYVVDDHRIPDVRLIVDADGPVLVEVVARPRREVVLRTAECVVEDHVQPVARSTLLER